MGLGNLIGRIIGRGRESIARLPSHKPLSIRESVGWPDPDETLAGHQNYRNVSGRSVRRIPEGERRRALQMAWDEFRQNPIANRIIGIRADFIIGTGIVTDSKDEELRDFLKEFWEDRVNDFPGKQKMLARSFRLDGELLGEPLVNDLTGRTRVLWSDVATIGIVLPHAKFYSEPGSIRVLRGSSEVEAVIVAPGEPEIPWSKLGDRPAALFFRANPIVGDLRGFGDLYHSFEYVLEMDNATFAMLERFNVAITYIWWVTSKGGMNDPEVDRVLSVLRNAKAGESLYTRPDVDIKSLVPQIPAVEFAEMLRAVKNIVLGGAGIPEAWFADGDAANRATVVGQADPTFKSMDGAQSEFKQVLRTLCAFAIERAAERGLISPTAAAAQFDLVADAVTQKDEMRIADVLVKVSTVLDYAVEVAGALTRKEAAMAFRRLAAPLMTIDPELPEELAKTFENPTRPSLVRPGGTPDVAAEQDAAETVREMISKYKNRAV